MDFNKNSIGNFFICIGIGVVLGAGAVYYHYEHTGGELDKRLDDATRTINEVRKQQQREITELYGIVNALQSSTDDSQRVTDEISSSREDVGKIDGILDRNNGTINELTEREKADRDIITASRRTAERILTELQAKTKNN